MRMVAARREKTGIRHITITRALHTILCAALCSFPAQLMAEVELDEIRMRNLEQTTAWFETQKTAAATNEHWKILPRIRVDRKDPSVTFKAEATGLESNEIVEFYLIGERSGNAYEAIAVALAEPADIARAIEKIGIPRGLHADPHVLRFWPQGERVHLYLNEHHAADLMVDTRTGRTAKQDGFVFTASRYVQHDGTNKLAAQVEPPFSIASNYNEPNTILDVSYHAPQSEVYTYQVQNPDIRFAPGELLTVRIVPERTDGSLRVQQMHLTASRAQRETQIPLADLRFTLRQEIDTGEITHLTEAPPQAFLAHIREMVSQQKDPFIVLDVGHGLSLAQAHSMARMIEMMENNEGLRVLPPPEGNLYYRAFIPDESRRDRAARIAHPWELHLSHDAAPTLTYIEEEWEQGEVRPHIKTKDITIDDPETLSKKMRELRPDINAVFIYAPLDMRMETIMEIVQHFRATHPFIHIFMEPSPHDQTSDATPAATSE